MPSAFKLFFRHFTRPDGQVVIGKGSEHIAQAHHRNMARWLENIPGRLHLGLDFFGNEKGGSADIRVKMTHKLGFDPLHQ
ncbi:hypothetical protein [Xanthomonas campestris]|uniref:hypothetical protein n=1 Tax=Xanthomonas campestris TaxID=339 RepID=UPI003D085AD3